MTLGSTKLRNPTSTTAKSGVSVTIRSPLAQDELMSRGDNKVGSGKATGGQVSILTGDSRTLLPTLPADSIQCCVTSPPYWGLRDYEHDQQIGAEPSPREYVDNLVDVFDAVHRVLRPDGTVWLNVGDGYARNGGQGNCGPNAKVGNTKKMIQKRNCKVPEVWGLKDRDLMGLPWRVAFALQEAGWILRSRIVWIKKTAMPESVKNRPTNATEELFLFAKQPGYYYDSKGVREESGANLRNYWRLGPDPSGAGHPAAFPRELARRCILLGSRPGDTILDPFGGSGTTGAVAQEEDRNAILIELNPNYNELAKKRVKSSQRRLRFQV
jgi:site-specific DNA-methyltransferase (cytosine-N4-specific)